VEADQDRALLPGALAVVDDAAAAANVTTAFTSR
jgi:hypothetical protein